MSELLSRLLNLGMDCLGRQPVIAVAFAAALVAVFLVTVRLRPRAGEPAGLGWHIYRQLARLVWALALVATVAWTASALQGYLDRTLADFRHNNGRVTEVNLNAVRTIWGGEQTQGELTVALRYEEEETERIESEDLSKPAVFRKKKVTYHVKDNPFVRARHEVSLRQNPRKKGSAYYQGYETDCRFVWTLRNPAVRELQAVVRFPLPSAAAMYDNLAVTLNGSNVLAAIRVENGALVLERTWDAGETWDLAIAFQSRGLTYWYFQVREAREIRDFELTLRLPDLPKKDLNYPEGCMTPTEITSAGSGTVLAYRLDRALSNKGMGIQLPKLKQPGETTAAVLGEAGKGWTLLFAALLLGGALTGSRFAVVSGVLIAAGAAFTYGLLGDISVSRLGFWGTAGVVVLPVYIVLAWLVTRLHAGAPGKALAAQLLLFGLVYPCVAGLDDTRQTLYLNLAAFVFLLAAAWLVVRYARTEAAK